MNNQNTQILEDSFKSDKKISTLLSKLKTISDIKLILEDGMSLIIASPLGSYSIQNKEFKKRQNTLISVSRNKDAFYFKDIEIYHNASALVEKRSGREIIKNASRFSSSKEPEETVLNVLKYNGNKKSKILIIDSSKSVYLPESNHNVLVEYLKCLKTKKHEISDMLKSYNVTDNYKTTNGQLNYKKSANKSLVLNNTSSGGSGV